MCNLGDKCNREICFFAHSTTELRTPEPMPLATGDTPAGQAAASAAGIQVTTGGFEGLPESMPQTGNVLVLYNGQVVELASSSYVNPVAEASAPGNVVVGGLPSIHEQQQLHVLMQQQAPQQGQLQAASMGAGSSAAAGGMIGRVVPVAANQQQQVLQDLSQFDSFTSQSSLQQPGQQLLRQDLGNFESFTSQGSSLQQLQLGQQSFTSNRQGDVSNLRGDLSGFDSFSTQSSRGGLAGIQQLQQHSAGQMLLRQDLSTFESFTSQGSRSGGPGLGALQQLQQLQQQSVAGPLSLRQDLPTFESFTSQGSRGGLSGVQGEQPMLMRQDYDSFTSQCSTSSQVLGAGFKSLPVSPLMDRAAGLQVQPSGASFSGVQSSGGSFSVQRSGGSLSGIAGVQPSGSSFTAQLSNRIFRPMQAGVVPQPAVVYQTMGSGAGASSSSAAGQVLQGVQGLSAGVYQVAAPQQQQQQAQQMTNADLQQQLMQLQLQAQESWKLE